MMRKQDLETIKRSTFFNPDWYRAVYPDAARSALAPEEHYLLVGAPLERDPGPDFSTKGYLMVNPDVQKTGMIALLHYERYGKAERRTITSSTDRQPAAFLADR